jgi:phenylalanyl-tRNA synthetase beta chain
LIAELGGGTVAPGIVDVYPAPVQPLTLPLRMERMNALLGTAIGADEAATILTALGIVVAKTGDGFSCTVPTYRPDLLREVDLYEEVVRVWGMERVISTLPGGRYRVGGLTPYQRLRDRVALSLRAAGLNEHIGLAFADPADGPRLGWALGPDEVPVALMNPMSEEQAHLRLTTLPGLLKAVAHNQRRSVPDVHLYELGSVFWTSPGRKLPKERLVVAGALAGAWERTGWSQPARALDFFDGKGVVETLMDEIGVTRWRVRAAEHPWLQSGRSADVIVSGDVVGWVGEVAPDVLEAYDAAGPVTVFEIEVKALAKAGFATAAYTEVPRLPAVTLDVALVVPDEVTVERATDAIRSAGGPLLESARLFDVYRDDPSVQAKRLPEGAKSLAFSLTYRAADRTLTDDEVSAAHERLLRKVCGALGAEVRG